MIKNFKINSDEIYEILEKLTDLVNKKQLSKLDYSKWKILSNLAKKVDETIYFDYHAFHAVYSCCSCRECRKN